MSTNIIVERRIGRLCVKLCNDLVKLRRRLDSHGNLQSHSGEVEFRTDYPSIILWPDYAIAIRYNKNRGTAKLIRLSRLGLGERPLWSDQEDLRTPDTEALALVGFWDATINPMDIRQVLDERGLPDNLEDLDYEVRDNVYNILRDMSLEKNRFFVCNRDGSWSIDISGDLIHARIEELLRRRIEVAENEIE